MAALQGSELEAAAPTLPTCSCNRPFGGFLTHFPSWADQQQIQNGPAFHGEDASRQGYRHKEMFS